MNAAHTINEVTPTTIMLATRTRGRRLTSAPCSSVPSTSMELTASGASTARADAVKTVTVPLAPSTTASNACEE